MKETLQTLRAARRALVVTALLVAAGLAPLAAEDAEPFIQVIPRAEIGFVAVLRHVYQSGDDAGSTRFDFVTQGGQDILFPYQRYAADVVLAGRHRVTLLYQPLTLNTRSVVDRNGSNGGLPVEIDETVFPVGTDLDLTYGFDFWRTSYLYDFAKSPDTILGAGISLQIRNASIVFSGVDPAGNPILTSQQNVGPVPILKVRAAHQFSPFFDLDFEADGFYASSAFFNGSANPFKGWVWDAALTAKTHFTPAAAAFLVIRSIGGGAEGNNAYDYTSWTTSTPGSYTYNELATLAVSLGFTLER
jgi:hypothetical protein